MKLIDRLSKASAGMTLIEVLVSVVILTMSVMMIYSGTAGVTRAHAELSSPEDIANSIAGLNDTLKNYVSADAGPGTAADFAPMGSWALPKDACAYALEAGCTHTADSFLAQRIKDQHPGAALSYSVAAPAVPDGPLQITYSISWP